ncbi:MAG: methyltransferase [Clostridia bacterium]|nr:methyltransferase [Clostridia bacterium]
MKTKTCKVSDLFDVQYGNSLELVYLNKKDNGTNFISRTAKRNGLSAKVEEIPFVPPFSAGLITVAVGGSVLETFLQTSPFYTGFHVMVLTPLVEMNNAVKLYYCQCIRENQYKYSYGRQANSSLPDLQIPKIEFVPDYIKTFSLKEYGKSLLNQVDFPNNEVNYEQSSKSVPLEQLFYVENGIASSQLIRNKIKESDNWIPYIRPSYRQETSIDAYVNRKLVPDEKRFLTGTLYVSTDGQGSHTFSYVSTFEFVPNSNVSVLIPKREMSLQEKLFYAQCITNNRYKFSYGRKPKGARLKAVLLPEYPPDFVLEYNIDKVMQGFNSVLEMV